MNRGTGLRFENEMNAESLIPKARQGKAVKLDICLTTFALRAKRQGECTIFKVVNWPTIGKYRGKYTTSLCGGWLLGVLPCKGHVYQNKLVF